MHRLAAFAIAALTALPLGAQSSPYTENQSRAIKALSEEQIAQYRSGAGMGLAIAAELNGYPGPKHLLELSTELALSAEQKTVIERIFDEMKTEAVAIGEKLVAAEQELDQLFASKKAETENVQRLTAVIGELSGKLRYTHLRAHLATLPLLTEEQLTRYAELRGYGKAQSHHAHH